jgi:hypothetical protein
MPFLMEELAACLIIFDEILNYLEDNRIALEKETESTPAPPFKFDPLKTIGKYE